MEAEQLFPTTSHLRQLFSFSAVCSRGRLPSQHSHLQYRPRGDVSKWGAGGAATSLAQTSPSFALFAAKGVQFNVRQSKTSMCRRRKREKPVAFVELTSVGLFF